MSIYLSVSMVLLVALGGAMGALLRFLMTFTVTGWLGRDFPWGTLSVNVCGAFLMGLLFPWFASKIVLSPTLQALIIVGFLGSFTTFSAFTYDNFELLLNQHYGRFLLNSMGSILLTLVALLLGYLTAHA